MQPFEVREPIVIDQNGQKLFGVLHRPPNILNSPCVLICHGLAGDKTGRFRLAVILAEMLAKEGIATLRFDFRGSGDSEGEFSETTVQSQIDDTLKTIEYLQMNPYIDSKRIGIQGRSFGGVIALMAAKISQNIKSIALWAPLFDATQWDQQWKKASSWLLTKTQIKKMMQINGQQASMLFFEQLFKINMGAALDALKTIPLLHIHGEKDVVVHIEHADKYVQARQKMKEITEFIRLQESDHDFSNIEEQQIALNKTCEWFKKTLLTSA